MTLRAMKDAVHFPAHGSRVPSRVAMASEIADLEAAACPSYLPGDPGSGDLDEHMPVRLHAGHVTRGIRVVALGRRGAGPGLAPRAGAHAIGRDALADEVG